MASSCGARVRAGVRAYGVCPSSILYYTNFLLLLLLLLRQRLAKDLAACWHVLLCAPHASSLRHTPVLAGLRGVRSKLVIPRRLESGAAQARIGGQKTSAGIISPRSGRDFKRSPLRWVPPRSGGGWGVGVPGRVGPTGTPAAAVADRRPGAAWVEPAGRGRAGRGGITRRGVGSDQTVRTVRRGGWGRGELLRTTTVK